MGYKCCVPFCATGLEKNSSISIHKFPPCTDAKQLNKWIAAIPRRWTNSELEALRTNPSHNYRVCSLHFEDKYFVTISQDSNIHRKRPSCKEIAQSLLINRRLTSEAVPCIFPGAPSYLSKVSTPERSTNLTSAESRRKKTIQQHEESIVDFLSKDAISDFQVLSTFSLPEHLNCYHKHVRTSTITFFTVGVTTDDSLEIVTSLAVSETLVFEITVGGVKHPSLAQDLAPDGKLSSFSQLENILARLKNSEIDMRTFGYEQYLIRANANLNRAIFELSLKLEAADDIDDDVSRKEAAYARLSFLAEQLSMTNLDRKKYAYSQELLAFAYILQHHSPSAYRFIKESNTISLPSVRHLQRLSSSLSNDPDIHEMEAYLKIKIRDLPESERVVLLAIDEVYSAKRMEFSGGKIFGTDSTSEDLAKTVCAFLIKSIHGDFQEIISLVPKSHLTAQDLHKHLLDCLVLLSRVGVKPVVCIVDNNPVNRSLFKVALCKGQMQSFIPNPVTSEPLFLLFDPVHNFKNILNNWIARQVFQFPDFTDPQKIQRADFAELHRLHEIELNHPARIAYKLTRRSLNPTNLERTNVQHAANIFNESTIDAARFYSLSSGLITFMQLVLSMWTIWNIKTTRKGKEKRLSDATPLLPNDKRLDTLRRFSDFFQRWEESKLPGLTAPTFLAVKSCSSTLADLAEHLFSHHSFPYVLPGRLVSDWIEQRFGRYRQFHGGNYYISVRQIFQAEKKIRVSTLLAFHGKKLKDLQSLEKLCSTEFCNPLLALSLSSIDNMEASLSSSDRNLCSYLGGYVSNSLTRQLKCIDCKSLLSTDNYLDLVAEDEAEDRALIQIRDRGGLKCPSQFVFFLMKVSYFVFGKLQNNNRLTTELLYSGRAVQCIVELCQDSIRSCSEFREILSSGCNCGMSATSFSSKILTPAIRTYLKNFVNETNDDVKNRRPVKRKLFKLSDG